MQIKEFATIEKKRDSMGNEELGVAYSHTDYASLMQRIATDTIDLLFLFIIVFVATAVFPDDYFGVILILWLSFCAFYLVVLKVTKIRTVGYRLMRLQLVTIRGKPASLWNSIVRSSFALLGPLNCGLDLFWIPGDPSHQALRDKFAETLVVRNGAVPSRTSPVRYRHYFFFGWAFLFSEVDHDKANCGNAPAANNPEHNNTPPHEG